MCYNSNVNNKEGVTDMTFEIYFTDLTEEAQKSFLKAEGLQNAEDGNYDIFPIAVLEIDREED